VTCAADEKEDGFEGIAKFHQSSGRYHAISAGRDPPARLANYCRLDDDATTRVIDLLCDIYGGKLKRG
jgi:hypothetical protein